jgi:hypothetical protein
MGAKSAFAVLISILTIAGASPAFGAACFQLPLNQASKAASFHTLPTKLCINDIKDVEFGWATADMTFIYRSGSTYSRAISVVYDNDPYDTAEYPVRNSLVTVDYASDSTQVARAEVYLRMGDIHEFNSSSLILRIVDTSRSTPTVSEIEYEVVP